MSQESCLRHSYPNFEKAEENGRGGLEVQSVHSARALVSDGRLQEAEGKGKCRESSLGRRVILTANLRGATLVHQAAKLFNPRTT